MARHGVCVVLREGRGKQPAGCSRGPGRGGGSVAGRCGEEGPGAVRALKSLRPGLGPFGRWCRGLLLQRVLREASGCAATPALLSTVSEPRSGAWGGGRPSPANAWPRPRPTAACPPAAAAARISAPATLRCPCTPVHSRPTPLPAACSDIRPTLIPRGADAAAILPLPGLAPAPRCRASSTSPRCWPAATLPPRWTS